MRRLALLMLLAFAWSMAVSAQEATPAPYTLIFDAQPGPDVPTLHTLTAGAVTDGEAIARVVDYYAAHRDTLSLLWREANETRLAALFSMYIVHISTIYGETSFPASFIEYLGQARAHCGTYTYAQWQIADALGLTWRTIEFVGNHAYLEIQVDGEWEVFDATTNTWLSRPTESLMRGEQREYRYFYTPILDADFPDARLHFTDGYDMQLLRRRMPTLGVLYIPQEELRIGEHTGGINS